MLPIGNTGTKRAKFKFVVIADFSSRQCLSTRNVIKCRTRTTSIMLMRNVSLTLEINTKYVGHSKSNETVFAKNA